MCDQGQGDESLKYRQTHLLHSYHIVAETVSLILYEFPLTTLLMPILLGDIKSYHDLSCYMYIYGQLTSVILLPLHI